MKKERINLIIKTTSQCNFSCNYCYDAVEKNNLKNKFITLDIVEKIAKTASKAYKNIAWTWHGGEPLLLGEEFYRKAHEIIYKYFNKENIEISMQSNGSLYEKNKEWINDLGIVISFSYDFTNENKNRGNVEDISFIKNAINVTNFEDSKTLVETYKKIIGMGKTASFNKIFLQNYSKEQLEEMADNYYELFEYILFNNEPGVYFERELKSLVGMILFTDKRLCNTKDCIGGFLSVNSDGIIYMCDRFNSVNGSDYNLGNILDLEYTMLEVFENENFKKIKKEQEEFKEKCKRCEIKDLCSGFCKANRLKDGKINISEKDEQECIFRKRLILKIFDRLYNLNEKEYLKLNKQLFDMLFENKFTPGFLLEEFDD